MSSIGTKILIFFVVFVIYYCLNQIFSFYGVSSSTYDVYYFFYVFLLLCVLVLPNEAPSL